MLAPRHCAEVRDELAGAERAAGSRQEVEGVRLDGHHFSMELALAATRGPSGPFHAAVARDIEPRRRAERERSELHRKLVQASRTAGIAEVTSGVLHNIGNALTGVNISASLLAQKLERVDLSRLLRAADLLEPSASGRASPRPGAVPRYLRRLTASAETQRRALRAETAVILEGIQHVNHVIRQQQSLARSAAVSEPTDLGASIREAVAVHVAEHHGIEGLAPVVTDRHKLLQVLVNLVNNAKQALTGVEHAVKRLTVRLKRPRPGWIRIEVADNGAGIDRAHLARLFEYGFTTRPGGHGFGLHSSALLAEDLGGRLSCESAGTGYGAVFTLDFPDDQREAA